MRFIHDLDFDAQTGNAAPNPRVPPPRRALLLGANLEGIALPLLGVK